MSKAYFRWLSLPQEEKGVIAFKDAVIDLLEDDGYEIYDWMESRAEELYGEGYMPTKVKKIIAEEICEKCHGEGMYERTILVGDEGMRLEKDVMVICSECEGEGYI